MINNKQAIKVKTKLYILTLFIISLALFFLISKQNHFMASWFIIVLWGFLQFALESLYIKLRKGATSSVSFATLFAAIILFGPMTSGIIALFQGITWQELTNFKKDSLAKWAFNSIQDSICTISSALTYTALGGLIFASTQKGFSISNFPSQIIPLLAAILVFYIINTFLVSLAIFFDKGMSLKDIWKLNFSWGDLNYLALGFIGIILAQLYYLEPLALILLIIPLAIARQTLSRYMKLQEAYSSTIAALIKAIEAKDPYTKGHSERVADISAKVAKQLNLSQDQVEALERIAVLHDIGKIGIPKKILLKPGRLSKEEFARIKEHPKIGARILKDVQFLKDGVSAVYYHHERFDGSGYNSGLRGKKIPLFARIISLADSYDAMTSNRAYRNALSKGEVINQLLKNSGSQFDATLVQAMLQVINVGSNSKEQPQSSSFQAEMAIQKI